MSALSKPLPYDPKENIQIQLVPHKTQFQHELFNNHFADFKITQFKPLKIHDETVVITRHVITGMELTEVDFSRHKDAIVFMRIQYKKITLQCQNGELNEMIQKIFQGKFPLPN